MGRVIGGRLRVCVFRTTAVTCCVDAGAATIPTAACYRFLLRAGMPRLKIGERRSLILRIRSR